MFWKYTIFELKLIMRNRKNWLLGIVLILFFPFYFLYFNQTEPESLKERKEYEESLYDPIFYQFAEIYQETPEGEEVYDNLLEQASLVRMQNYYLSLGGKSDEEYITTGLELNELRLRVHELNNVGIAEHLIIPEEDVLRENTLLKYIQEHDLPLQPNPFVASNFLTVVIMAFSGILFFLFILMSSNEILTKEQNHQTVVSGFPINFMTKVNSKVFVYFIYLLFFLCLGLIAGTTYAANKSHLGDFSYPTLIYKGGDYVAISVTQYLIYSLLLMSLIIIFVLYLSVLLNMLFKNAYLNIVVGLSIFFIPALLKIIGINQAIVTPIKLLDFANVLSGKIAVELGNAKIQFSYAVIWLLILIGIVYSIIFFINKLSYKKANV